MLKRPSFTCRPQSVSKIILAFSIPLFIAHSASATGNEESIDQHPTLRGITVAPDPKLMPSYSEETSDVQLFAQTMNTPPAPRTESNASALDSWDQLPNLTARTLSNLSNGDLQGVRLVHSLEDFSHSGPGTMVQMNDRGGVDQQFIDEYISGFMGYRYHIAMSLLAFDSEGPISPTFGPASFIVSCKSENIVATSLEDCNSADECFSFAPSRYR